MFKIAKIVDYIAWCGCNASATVVATTALGAIANHIGHNGPQLHFKTMW